MAGQGVGGVKRTFCVRESFSIGFEKSKEIKKKQKKDTHLLKRYRTVFQTVIIPVEQFRL